MTILAPAHALDHQPCAIQTLQISQIWNEVQPFSSPQPATSLEFPILVYPANVSSPRLEISASSWTLPPPSGFLVLPHPRPDVGSQGFLTVVPLLYISFFLCQLPCSDSGSLFSRLHCQNLVLPAHAAFGISTPLQNYLFCYWKLCS